MPNDYEEVLTRTAVDSNIVRLRPNAHVQIFVSGTETQAWEGLTDASGHFAVPSLDTGKYDLKVDGKLVKTFHHVKADHTHSPDETWIMTRHGAQTANKDEDQNCAVYAAPAAGTIIKIVAVAERIAAGGDITIHLLKGPTEGSGILTCASNSAWNRRLYNSGGSTLYRHVLADSNPDIAISANEAVTMGLVHAVNGVEGLTLQMIFRVE